MRILLVFAILCAAAYCQPPPPPPPPVGRDAQNRFNQRANKQHNVRYVNSNSVITRKPPGRGSRPVQAKVYPSIATKAPAYQHVQPARAPPPAAPVAARAAAAPAPVRYPQVPAQAPVYPQARAAAPPGALQPAFAGANWAQFTAQCKQTCQYRARPEPPFCGVNGVTYTSDCEMDCDYTDKLCDGACPCTYEYPAKGSGCVCIRENDMQCVYDGKVSKTVLNSCEAMCSGGRYLFEGDCARKPMRAMQEIQRIKALTPVTAG